MSDYLSQWVDWERANTPKKVEQAVEEAAKETPVVEETVERSFEAFTDLMKAAAAPMKLAPAPAPNATKVAKPKDAPYTTGGASWMKQKAVNKKTLKMKKDMTADDGGDEE